MFCQKCGSKINQGDRFCYHCGAPVPPQEPQMTDLSSSSTGRPEHLLIEPPLPAPPPPPKKERRALLVVLLVVGCALVFLALLFGLYFLTAKAPETEEHSSSVSVESPVLSAAPESSATSPAPSPDPSSDPSSSSSIPENTPKTEDIYDEYEEIAEDLLEQFGPGKILTDEYGYGSASGLFTVRLLDFNGDGIQELYCAFSDSPYVYRQAVYGYRDGRAYRLLAPSPCANNGTDVSPNTSLCERGGKLYLKTGDHTSFEGDLFTVSDKGEWVSEFSYYAPYMEEGGEFLIDGEAVSEEAYKAALSQFRPYETIFYTYDQEENPFHSILEKTEGNLRLLLGEDYEEALQEYAGSTSAGQEIQTAGGYILPESHTRLLTKADLAGLSEEELELARNEIYARHGRKFQDAGIRAYFESQPWYQGTIEPEAFDASVLSEIEKKNLQLILEAED